MRQSRPSGQGSPSGRTGGPRSSGPTPTNAQGNRKTREGTSHPDRNAQFEYLNAEVSRFLNRCQPAISVDTKKKELVGPYKNSGREWQKKGEPKSPEEQRVIGLLKNDPQMRTAFINQVAAPIANKMFECGMIP